VLLVKAVDTFRRKQGDSGPGVLECSWYLADFYSARGECDKAEPLFRQLLAAHRRDNALALSAGDASVLSLAIRSYQGQGRHKEAEQFAREWLQVGETKLADGWGWSYLQSLLGGSLLAQKKYAEAEPLLLKGYEGMKQREAQQVPVVAKRDLTDALERLAQLYDAMSQKDKAAEWRKKLEATRPAKPLAQP
jgi:tetratricopeptide (TPR) repeat protein